MAIPLQIESDSTSDPTNLEQLETHIAELSAHIQAATYRLLRLVGTYDQLEGWTAGGFVSCAHWLAWRTGDDLITAREKVRVARALEQLPLISAAFARAELSYSKVRAITRVATPDNETHLLTMSLEATASQLERVVRGVRRAQPLELAAAQAQYEGRYLQYHYDDNGMLELRARLTPEAGALLVKALEAAADALANSDEETSDQVENGNDETSHSQRQADALVLLAESALDHRLARGNRAERYQVMVHVDAEALKTSPESAITKAATNPHFTEAPVPQTNQVATPRNSAEAPAPSTSSAPQENIDQVATVWNSAEAPAQEMPSPAHDKTGQVATVWNSAEAPAPEIPPTVHDKTGQVATPRNSAEAWFRSELENGIGLCTETVRRLTCDSSTVEVIESADGTPLHMGRKTRRPTAALTRALQNRDRGCQFPGCTHTRYVEAHHLVHWARGGPTDLTNLVLLCSHHHHAVHEQGFHVSRGEDGALHFHYPDGTALPNAPRPLRLVSDPIPLLLEQHREQELHITHTSGSPTEWTGFPFDLGEAVALVLPAEDPNEPADEQPPWGDCTDSHAA